MSRRPQFSLADLQPLLRRFYNTSFQLPDDLRFRYRGDERGRLVSLAAGDLQPAWKKSKAAAWSSPPPPDPGPPPFQLAPGWFELYTGGRLQGLVATFTEAERFLRRLPPQARVRLVYRHARHWQDAAPGCIVWAVRPPAGPGQPPRYCRMKG